MKVIKKLIIVATIIFCINSAFSELRSESFKNNYEKSKFVKAYADGIVALEKLKKHIGDSSTYCASEGQAFMSVIDLMNNYQKTIEPIRDQELNSFIAREIAKSSRELEHAKNIDCHHLIMAIIDFSNEYDSFNDSTREEL